MNLSYISAEAWKTFEERYPNAYHFLLRETLKEELRVLENEAKINLNPQRRAWVENRLQELRWADPEYMPEVPKDIKERALALVKELVYTKFAFAGSSSANQEALDDLDDWITLSPDWDLNVCGFGAKYICASVYPVVNGNTQTLKGHGIFREELERIDDTSFRS